MEQTDPPRTNNTNWTINVSDLRTIQVSNVSLAASDRDIMEFFSFSGDIHFVELQRETEISQKAFVTFKEPQGADTAMLLSGANINNNLVSIAPVEDYQLPPNAPPLILETNPTGSNTVVNKAEGVVSTMLAKGFVLGKNALNRAKAFDDKHHLTSNASATVASIDNKIGLSEKLSVGTVTVNEKVRQMDEIFHVSDKTKLAIAAAEQTGSAIMSNRYMLTGASWVTAALGAVARAAEDVGTMTKEKVERAEEEKNRILHKEREAMVNEFANIFLDESSAPELPVVGFNNLADEKHV